MGENVAFKKFELEGWKRCATAYEDKFSALTTLAVPALLEAVGAGPGMRVLDIATGPGMVAAGAAALGAYVIAVDFSPEMVACAHSRHAQHRVTFTVGDAEALDFEDASFDAATMSFGLLHLGHPEHAIAEAHRVLKPGGKFAFTVWAPPTEALVFDVVLRGIETHGDPSVVLPAGPPFFKYADPRAAEQETVTAGFRTFSSEKLPLVWIMPSGAALFEAILEGTARTGALLRAQPAPALAAIREKIVNELEERFHAPEGGVAVPMPAMRYTARR